MKRFSITDLPLQGLKRVRRESRGDDRGFLSRVFCLDELSAAGWTSPIKQINHTYTAKVGTVRGLHFQYAPDAEVKLVSCLKGEVWDVAVDLRHDSPSFLEWHAEHLSASSLSALLIPEGFAHGFQTLTDNVELLYCHSSPYSSEAEGGLNPRDQRLSIRWPLPISQISIRDSNHPMLGKEFIGLDI